MAIINLTFTGSENKIAFGVPETVTITSSVPSIIHYTLDETEPTEDSLIYTGPIEIPDGTTNITLKAFAIDNEGNEGPVFTQIYAPDVTDIDGHRLIGQEGIAVDRYDDPLNEVIGYDVDGDEVEFTDIEDLELRKLYTERGRLGIDAGTAKTLMFLSPEESPYPYDDDWVAFSDASDKYFNPNAKVIVVDSRKDNTIEIINRPYGSLRNIEKDWWGQAEFSGSQYTYMSGGFVRSCYDPKNGVFVTYYFDKNTCRWVKSIRDQPSSETLRKVNFGQTGQPLYFQWLQWGRQSSKIF